MLSGKFEALVRDVHVLPEMDGSPGAESSSRAPIAVCTHLIRAIGVVVAHVVDDLVCVVIVADIVER